VWSPVYAALQCGAKRPGRDAKTVPRKRSGKKGGGKKKPPATVKTYYIHGPKADFNWFLCEQTGMPVAMRGCHVIFQCHPMVQDWRQTAIMEIEIPPYTEKGPLMWNPGDQGHE
jgi:hypothetical protein